jgi:phthiodiolone/phenolphthiodiolone dimycocerosates ketoreductase
MVSLWPDAIWTPEFTDLATVSRSPHRHLDGLSLAAAAAVLTTQTRIATSVIDTVRRHPAMLAQTALTISHLSAGRFILGLGSGEMENITPYGFDFLSPVSRFEESLKVIKLLWHSDGPVDFEGRFYHLNHARLDAELFDDQPPAIWVGGSGPRTLGIAGRQADGWLPVGNVTPDSYAIQLRQVRDAAETAGRDPDAITAAGFVICLIGDDEEIAEMIEAPLVKAYLLQVRGDFLRAAGFTHPLGDEWRGIHDFDPGDFDRDRLLDFLDRVDPRAVLAVLPHGNPHRIGAVVKGFVDAGMQVPAILDYGGMAALRFAAGSAAKVRAAEDELIRLTGGTA